MITSVMPGPFGREQGIGVNAVFHRHDGRGGVRLTQSFQKWRNALRHLLSGQVRQAIKHINSRVQFGEQPSHFKFHLTLTGEAEISRGPRWSLALLVSLDYHDATPVLEDQFNAWSK